MKHPSIMRYGSAAAALVLLISIFTYSGNTNNQPAQNILPRDTEGEEFSHAHLTPELKKQFLFDAKLRMQKGNVRMQRMQGLKITGGEADTFAGGLLTGTWAEVGSYNTAGRVWDAEIDFSTNAVYVFSQGGNLWKGDFNGGNWEIINDNFNIQSVIFLRKIGSRLIAGIDAHLYEFGVQGFYYTDDEGTTWQTATGLENVDATGNVFAVTMLNNPAHTIYLLATEYDGAGDEFVSLYRSDDLGTSFSKIITYDYPTYGHEAQFAIWTPRYGKPDCYFAENSNFYKLDDTGMPQFISTVPTTDNNLRLLTGYQNADTNYIYFATSNLFTGEITFINSHDGGSTWESPMSFTTDYVLRNGFACSDKADRLVLGGINCYYSDNAGATWTELNGWLDYYDDKVTNLHADIIVPESFIDTVTSDRIQLIGCDGGLYKSYDGFSTVENISLEGLRNAQYYDVYTYREDPEIIYGGAQDQGYQRTDTVIDDAYYFDQLLHGDYGTFTSSDGGQTIWFQYPGLVTTISNAPESDIAKYYSYPISKLWLCPLVADPADNAGCWMGYRDHLYHLERTATVITADIGDFDFSEGSDAEIGAINISPVNSNYRYVLTTNGKFFYSTDGGINWTKTPAFTGPKVPSNAYWYKLTGTVIVPSKTNPEIVFVAGGESATTAAIYMSNDHGQTFTEMNAGMPPTFIYDMDVIPGDTVLFAATASGPYTYLKSQNAWFDLLGNHAPVQMYRSVDYIDEIKTARFGTYGRGIWDFKADIADYVSIAELNTRQLNIYPNPAANQIAISISQNISHAKIRIVDLNGNTILQLNDQSLKSNSSFQIKIPDLPAGNYFLIVENGDERLVEKVVVI